MVGAVAGDDGALAAELGVLEQLVDLAGFVDAAGDEDGVAVVGPEPRLRVHVVEDVRDDPLEPVLGAVELAEGGPPLGELGAVVVGQVLAGDQPLESAVDLPLGPEVLVDVAGLVADVADDAVLDGLVELVGVDEGAEPLTRPLLVAFEDGRAGEADEHGVREERPHGVVELARLGAVGLVHEHVDVALGTVAAGDRPADVVEVGGEGLVARLVVAVVGGPELVDERAEQRRGVGVELGDEVGAARGAGDVLADALEDHLDLLVELDAVGDDEDTGVGDVLADPLGEPDHREALARALGVPHDAALAALDERLGGPDAEVLVVAGELLGTAVEDDEVVDELQEAGGVEEPGEGAVEGVVAVGALVGGEVLGLGRVGGGPPGGAPPSR